VPGISDNVFYGEVKPLGENRGVSGEDQLFLPVPVPLSVPPLPLPLF
jgi:hypothetical protein